MKSNIILLIIALVLCGSCCRKFYPASVQESIRVKTRYEYIEKLRDTTVYVEVPREIERIVTRDTISHIENSVAYSDAIVNNGLLYHSLVNKQVNLPTVIQYKEVEIVRDSIVYRDSVKTVIQEVNRITWWQQTQLKLFRWLICIGIFYGAFRAIKYYLIRK